MIFSVYFALVTFLRSLRWNYPCSIQSIVFISEVFPFFIMILINSQYHHNIFEATHQDIAEKWRVDWALQECHVVMSTKLYSTLLQFHLSSSFSSQHPWHVCPILVIKYKLFSWIIGLIKCVIICLIIHYFTNMMTSSKVRLPIYHWICENEGLSALNVDSHGIFRVDFIHLIRMKENKFPTFVIQIIYSIILTTTCYNQVICRQYTLA